MGLFTHLRVHSEYSLRDGIIRIEELAKQCVVKKQSAVALTDSGNMFAAIKFYRAMQSVGIKPILGADIQIQLSQSETAQATLLCLNNTGYKNLCSLLSEMYLSPAERGKATLTRKQISTYADGLVMLSGAMSGDVGKSLLAGQTHSAHEQVNQWAQLFPKRYYLEIQRLGRAREEEYIEQVITLAAELQLPVVATNEACFIDASDYAAHDVRTCIYEGRLISDTRRSRKYTQQQYLAASEEMQRKFSDIPEAIDNANQLAARCNVVLELGNYCLPHYPLAGGVAVDDWLRQEAELGLRQIASASPPNQDMTNYKQRISHELDVISKMGFAGYFLIVADFVKWAKENHVPVGPGRGSGAGSLVAFALGITEIDPLKYDLLFERFLNPERISMPDFDIDFCMDRRDEVIRYVEQKYGKARVSQIITYGTMAAKAVIRDVGRVLGMPYKLVDQVAKLIPFAVDMTLERALQEEPQLKVRYENEDDIRNLINTSMKLEGITKSVGRHAGGIVIAPAHLTEFMPLYRESDSEAQVTQYDMLDVEHIGLVKFDFLGLRTLTILHNAVLAINQYRELHNEQPVNLRDLSLTDSQTYQLICRAETTAIFQLESRGMRELIKRWQPDTFDDLVALVAMFRPGPLQSGMVDDFISRKQGKAKLVYLHPALEPILKSTWGVIVYQEQVMQIAQTLAGYSLGAADLLRRAMGKKKPEEMAKQRAIFLAGATARDIPANTAIAIFDLMQNFAEYGFNKSHSTAYALVAYQTAWLKAHYPAHFMAAVLSSDLDDTDKLISQIRECRRMKLTVRAPDVNMSDVRFVALDARTIAYGLAAIKGLGQAVASHIVEEKQKADTYTAIIDFFKRINSKIVNKRAIEALVSAGALDNLGYNRATLSHNIPTLVAVSEHNRFAVESGQDDIFGGETSMDVTVELVKLNEWDHQEKLLNEQAALGVTMSGHFMDLYEEYLSALNLRRISALQPGKCKTAGIITEVRIKNTRRGNLLILNIDDRDANLEITYNMPEHDDNPRVWDENTFVIADGNYQLDKYTGDYQIQAEAITTFAEYIEKHLKRAVVHIHYNEFTSDNPTILSNLLTMTTAGKCKLECLVKLESQSVRLESSHAGIKPSQMFFQELRNLFPNTYIQYIF